MSAMPQCQISRPGLSSVFTQSLSRPAGALGQETVGILLVRFGGSTQPSIQTTRPDRSYGSVGQPEKYFPFMIAVCLKRCSCSGVIMFDAVGSGCGVPGMICPSSKFAQLLSVV